MCLCSSVRDSAWPHLHPRTPPPSQPSISPPAPLFFFFMSSWSLASNPANYTSQHSWTAAERDIDIERGRERNTSKRKGKEVSVKVLKEKKVRENRNVVCKWKSQREERKESSKREVRGQRSNSFLYIFWLLLSRGPPKAPSLGINRHACCSKSSPIPPGSTEDQSCSNHPQEWVVNLTELFEGDSCVLVCLVCVKIFQHCTVSAS